MSSIGVVNGTTADSQQYAAACTCASTSPECTHAGNWPLSSIQWTRFVQVGPGHDTLWLVHAWDRRVRVLRVYNGDVHILGQLVGPSYSCAAETTVVLHQKPLLAFAQSCSVALLTLRHDHCDSGHSDNTKLELARQSVYRGTSKVVSVSAAPSNKCSRLAIASDDGVIVLLEVESMSITSRFETSMAHDPPVCCLGARWLVFASAASISSPSPRTAASVNSVTGASSSSAERTPSISGRALDVASGLYTFGRRALEILQQQISPLSPSSNAGSVPASQHAALHQRSLSPSSSPSSNISVIAIHDVISGECLHRFAVDTSLSFLGFDRSGRFLVAISREGQYVNVYDLANEKTIDCPRSPRLLHRVFRGVTHAHVVSVAVADHATALAITTARGTLHVYELASHRSHVHSFEDEAENTVSETITATYRKHELGQHVACTFFSVLPALSLSCLNLMVASTSTMKSFVMKPGSDVVIDSMRVWEFEGIGDRHAGSSAASKPKSDEIGDEESMRQSWMWRAQLRTHDRLTLASRELPLLARPHFCFQSYADSVTTSSVSPSTSPQPFPWSILYPFGRDETGMIDCSVDYGTVRGRESGVAISGGSADPTQNVSDAMSEMMLQQSPASGNGIASPVPSPSFPESRASQNSETGNVDSIMHVILQSEHFRAPELVEETANIENNCRN